MSFLRPEAVAALGRWAEPALSGAVLAVMLWVGASMLARGPLAGVVILVLAVGAGYWFRTALARARLRQAALGPGVVEVDERRIAYWGPETGAVVALDALVSVEIAARASLGAEAAWVLRPADGPPLVAPMGAKGAERLLEAFAALPGFSYDRAAAAMNAPEGTRSIVWRRDPADAASTLASGGARD